MRLFLPANVGIGDFLWDFLIQRSQLIGQVKKAMETIDNEVIVFCPPGGKTRIQELVQAVLGKIQIQETSFAGPGLMPSHWNGYTNVFTNPPEDLLHLNADPAKLPLPEHVPQGKDTIVLHAEASNVDRVLFNPKILETIKKEFNGQVISIGKTSKNVPLSPLKGDIDLRDQISLLESIMFIRKACCVISSFSWLRTLGHLYWRPILELGDEHVLFPDTVTRTAQEYQTGQFGLDPRWNQCFLYPSGHNELVAYLREKQEVVLNV